MKDWNYSIAPGQQAGTMRCGSCGQQIVAGEFRYRQKSKGGDWGYVQQHRECCHDDPMWSQLDARAAESEARHKEFVAACIAFRDKWGVDDLDDYIPSAPGALS